MLQYNIDSLIARGQSHALRCEDDLYFKEEDEFVVAAVFDGCSSGIDSHYASTMYKHKLDEIVDDMTYFLREDNNRFYPFKNINDLMYDITYEMCKKINSLKYDVNTEMLSTMVLLVINKCTKEYGIIFCGDGCCNINGTDYSVHEKNSSVWYLSTVKPSFFKEYFDSYCTKHYGEVDNGTFISISSDGIETYQSSYGSQMVDLAKMLFFNTETAPERYRLWNMQRIYNVLKNGKYRDLMDVPMMSIDDISIIKIKINDVKEN